MVARLTCVGGFGTFRETASFTADDSDEIVAAAGGHSITLVACRDAGVIGYGTAFHGELGPHGVALRLTTLSIVRIACGGSFVVAASSDGACYEWGQGSTEPKKLPEVAGVVDVAAGEGHALARTADNVVFSWGNNQYGQCGVGASSPRIDSPTALVERWKSVAAGAQHSAMIATNGDLYTFGWGQYHQLGLGSTADHPNPTCVTSLQGVGDYVRGVFTGLRQVACGAWHTVALTTTGDMYTWGWGQHGQLGGSHLASHVFPTLLSLDDEDATFVSIACGTRHTAGLTDDGRLHLWGMHTPSHDLVAGKSADANTTHATVAAPGCTAIAAGAYHTLLLTT